MTFQSLFWSRCTIVALFALCFQLHAQTAANRPPASAPVSWKDLELELGGKKQKKYDHVIDLGPLGAIGTLYTTPDPVGAACVTDQSYPVAPEGDRTIDIKVTTGAAQTVKLTVIYAGSRVVAGWLASGNGTKETVSLDPGASATLRVTYRVDDGKIQDLSLITLLSDGRPVTNISLDYLFVKQFVGLEYSSGMVLSGPSDASSPDYWLGTGPAPAMYTLFKACHWLTGDRLCNSWSTCNWIKRDDSDVSFRFTLQGHNESAPSSRSSEGHLRAVYRLSGRQTELR